MRKCVSRDIFTDLASAYRDGRARRRDPEVQVDGRSRRGRAEDGMINVQNSMFVSRDTTRPLSERLRLAAAISGS